MADPNAPPPPPPPADPAADQKLADLVNGAVKAHLGRALPKALEESVTPLLTGFKAELTALLPKAPPTPEAGKGTAVNPELEELRAEVKREKDARLTEKRQAREDKAHGDLVATLTGKVRPEAVRDVADLLFYARKAVKVGADGNVTMKVGDLDYPLAEGVGEYLKTKDAALYLPPPAPAAKGRGALPVRTIPQRQAPAGTPPGQAPQREDPAAKTARELGWT